MNGIRRGRARLVAVLWTVLGAGCQGPAMPTDPAPAARRYRDVTKHTPASVRSDRFRLDWTNKPALYRSYPGAETVALEGTRILTRPAVDAIAQAPATPTSAAALDLDLLGTVLFLAGGVTRARPSGGDIRATAAAGALYPNELYVRVLYGVPPSPFVREVRVMLGEKPTLPPIRQQRSVAASLEELIYKERAMFGAAYCSRRSRSPNVGAGESHGA